MQSTSVKYLIFVQKMSICLTLNRIQHFIEQYHLMLTVMLTELNPLSYLAY